MIIHRVTTTALVTVVLAVMATAQVARYMITGEGLLAAVITEIVAVMAVLVFYASLPGGGEHREVRDLRRAPDRPGGRDPRRAQRPDLHRLPGDRQAHRRRPAKRTRRERRLNLR